MPRVCIQILLSGFLILNVFISPVFSYEKGNTFKVLELGSDEVGVVKLSLGAQTVLRFTEPIQAALTDTAQQFEHTQSIEGGKVLSLKPKSVEPAYLYVWLSSGRLFLLKLEFVKRGSQDNIVDVLGFDQGLNETVSLNQILFMVKHYDNEHLSYHRLKKRLKRDKVHMVFKGENLKAEINDLFFWKHPAYVLLNITLKNTSNTAFSLKDNDAYSLAFKNVGGQFIKPDILDVLKQKINPNQSISVTAVFIREELKTDELQSIRVQTNRGTQTLQRLLPGQMDDFNDIKGQSV